VKTRIAYRYDRDAASKASGLRCSDPSLARQDMKDEADINTIVRNFGVTGKVTAPIRLPTFADYENVWDFQTAMNAVREAEAAFQKVPAAVRSRFGNDPAAFVSFCSDKDNLPELIRLGLAPDPAVPALTPAPPPDKGAQ